MRTTTTFFLLMISLFLTAQKHDYNWIRGQRAKGDPEYMGDLFNFNKSPLERVPRDAKFPIRETSTTISDDEGNLLFRTYPDDE